MEMDKYIGKLLDQRYQIQQIIGLGGMANVYRAYDKIQDRYVAIKILKDEYLDNEEFLRRFKNESKAIAALSHPNIVQIYDMNFHNSFYWIAMEFVDGITLKEYIEQQNVLNWKEAVHFVMQILLALQHAHNKGIVHRDVKPQNIMLLRNGTIKIMDFGIARFARNEAKTLTDRAIGSVHYISPEQARGDIINHTTDIYSVGVILFEMLTGSLPFEADNAVSVAIKQIEMDPIRPRQINNQIPKSLEQIVIKAMSKDKHRRYQSTTQMIKDLTEFKENPTRIINHENDKIKIFGKDIKKGYNNLKNKKSYKEDYEKENKKNTTAIQILSGIAAALVVASLIFVVVAYFVYNPFAPSREIKVPDLVGKVYQEILKEDKYKSFDIQLETTSYSEEYDEGFIFEQSPNPGRIVKNKAIIKVKVSKGRKYIQIPDLSKMEYSVAASQLVNLGLKVSKSEMYDPDVTQGFVIKTNPTKDSEVPMGTTVRIYVSIGKEQKMETVPDLKRIKIEDARKMIEDKGLRIGAVNTNDSSDVPEGYIIAQEPEAGSQVPINTFIDVIKSTGNKPEKKVTIPFKLPNITEIVNCSALLDGKEIKSERIEPAEVKIWSIDFSKEGGTGKAKVIIGGKTYTELIINFDQKTYDVITNNSPDFPRWPSETSASIPNNQSTEQPNFNNMQLSPPEINF